MVTLIFLRALFGDLWVNILTLSSLRVTHTEEIICYNLYKISHKVKHRNYYKSFSMPQFRCVVCKQAQNFCLVIFCKIMNLNGDIFLTLISKKILENHLDMEWVDL